MTFIKSFYSVPVSQVSLYIDLPGIDLVDLEVDLSMINRVRGLHLVLKGWGKFWFPLRWLGGGQGGEGDLFLEVLLQAHARLKGNGWPVTLNLLIWYQVTGTAGAKAASPALAGGLPESCPGRLAGWETMAAS